MSITYSQLQALAPLGIIALAPLVLVLLDATFTRAGREARERELGPHKSFLLAAVAAGFLISTLGFAVLIFERSAPAIALADSMFVIDLTSSFAIALLCSGGLLTVLFSRGYLSARGIHHGEYYPLLLLAIAGAIAVVCAGNLISLFVAMELTMLPVYVLVGFDRNSRHGSAAGISALMMGAFVSAISLYGIALIYGATGHFDYPGIRAAIDGTYPLAFGGLALLLVGILARQSSAPFHLWLPDLTERAPTVVAICVPTTIATAAAFALIRIFDSLALATLPWFAEIFWFLACASMVVGSLMALLQSNVKRMLAYGGVAHAGFFLVALIVPGPEARGAALLQITVFLFMQAGALGAISAMAQRGREWESLSDFAGLAQYRPILAAAMTLFLLALSGLPGTSGFVSRFVVMSVAVGDGQVLMTLLMTITSAILFAAYLRVPTAMYMVQATGDEAETVSFPTVFALTICALFTLYFGLFPGRGFVSFDLLDVVRRAAQP